ncbi:MAG: glycoside hydrolase family 130 protein [Synechococcaceae cyanobacterium]|nr:glycoside hydrolase family 130 protein [Synechococcaceae cyanobacterium]
MSDPAIAVRRLPVQLDPSQQRVLLRPFLPSLVVKPAVGDEEPAAVPGTGTESRLSQLQQRLLRLDPQEVQAQLERLRRRFLGRHLDLEDLAERHQRSVVAQLGDLRDWDRDRLLLLGCYLTHEYALESAALFNPSLVPHPDQGGLGPGEQRVVLSLRATGEGHISSIVFRSGVLDGAAEFRLEEPSPFVQQGEIRREGPTPNHYEVRYGVGSELSQRVLFPAAAQESNGLEDARFVAITREDGSRSWFATATAYDGREVRIQAIETEDFRHFRLGPLQGRAIRNKGLALFPRQVGGEWLMLGRQDGVNIQLMRSDRRDHWDQAELLLEPREPWEFVQLGNCGSPIETEAGWLVLTHGVGPMREYGIGVALLDRQDPGRVIGRLREPLLTPLEEERDGYVPNVVYSCGGMVHAGQLVLPYAVSDRASRIALVDLADLLTALSEPRARL